MKKILASKIIFFLVTTLVILSLNLTPLVLQVFNAPTDRTFSLVHNNTQDFFFYQSLMNQGANGANLTKDSYTSEIHEPSIIFSYFLFFGKISKLLGLPFPIMYHIIRIVFAFAFLFSCYLLLYVFSVPYPRLTYVIFLFAAPFMHEVESFGTKQSVEYMNWWTGIDPIRRAAYLPHHMIGAFLLILSILLIVKYIETKKIKNIIFLSIIAVTLAFVHTPSLFILLIILPPSICIYQGIKIIKNKKIQDVPYGLIVYWVIGVIALFFMVLQTSKGFPWSQYIDWEKNLQFPIQSELIGALGFLLPFSILGVFVALKSQKFSYILIVCWFIVPLLLIPFARLMNISNIRLIQGVPFLPLSILAVLGMKKIGELLIIVMRKIPTTRDMKIKNWQIITGWYCLFILLFTLSTLPSVVWSIKDQIREFMPLYGNVYLDNRLGEAFSFINKNVPKKSVTLATFYAGNYIPVFTYTTSYIGHSGYTNNLREKEPRVVDFFSNRMSEEQAEKFIDSQKIDIVFQGPEEKNLFQGILYPNSIIPIFKNEIVVIYEKK